MISTPTETDEDGFYRGIAAPHFSAHLDHLCFEWWRGDRKMTAYLDDDEAYWIVSVKTPDGLLMSHGDAKGFATAYRWLLDGGDIAGLGGSLGGDVNAVKAYVAGRAEQEGSGTR